MRVLCEAVGSQNGNSCLGEWVRLMRKLQSQGIHIYAYANNQYAGFAPDTVRTFRRLWEKNQPPGKRNKGEQCSENLEFSF